MDVFDNEIIDTDGNLIVIGNENRTPWSGNWARQAPSHTTRS